jgi:hypothetical protein
MMMVTVTVTVMVMVMVMVMSSSQLMIHFPGSHLTRSPPRLGVCF